MTTASSSRLDTSRALVSEAAKRSIARSRTITVDEADHPLESPGELGARIVRSIARIAAAHDRRIAAGQADPIDVDWRGREQAAQPVAVPIAQLFEQCKRLPHVDQRHGHLDDAQLGLGRLHLAHDLAQGGRAGCLADEAHTIHVLEVEHDRLDAAAQLALPDREVD